MLSFHIQPYLSVLPNIIYAFFLGLVITPFLRKFALKHKFSTPGKEESDPNERNYITKFHSVTMPRLGEFAMLIPLGLLMWRDVDLNTQILGIVLSILLIGMLGAFDSKYNLSEFVKLYLLFFATLILIFTGTFINVHSIFGIPNIDIFINNPLTSAPLSLLNIVATFMWVLVISTALSYVGGVDGLSEGTSAIAIMILTLIGIRNGDILTIAIGSLCFGGLLGLLPYNFHPAVIYSEHLIYGFIIAILAIISKGKFETSILILTVPLIDFLSITLTRVKKYFKENKKISIRAILHYMGTGDRNHLHHKLMYLGFSPPQISLVQYLLYGVLGFIAIAVSGLYLTFALLSSGVIIVLILYLITRKVNNGRKSDKL